MIRDSSITGMILMNASSEELTELYGAINKGLEAGNLKPVVGTELHLAEAPKAHHKVIENCAYGKIVLIP
jgi:NADPH2:quinone reductase